MATRVSRSVSEIHENVAGTLISSSLPDASGENVKLQNLFSLRITQTMAGFCSANSDVRSNSYFRQRMNS